MKFLINLLAFKSNLNIIYGFYGGDLASTGVVGSRWHAALGIAYKA